MYVQVMGNQSLVNVTVLVTQKSTCEREDNHKIQVANSSFT